MDKEDVVDDSNDRGFTSALLITTPESEEKTNAYAFNKEISTIKEKFLINKDLLSKIENTSPFIPNRHKSGDDQREAFLIDLINLNEQDGKVKKDYDSQTKVICDEDDDQQLKASYEEKDFKFDNIEDSVKNFKGSKNYQPRRDLNNYSPKKRLSISEYYNGMDKSRKDSVISTFFPLDSEFMKRGIENMEEVVSTSNSPLMVIKDKNEFLKERQKEINNSVDFHHFNLGTPMQTPKSSKHKDFELDARKKNSGDDMISFFDKLNINNNQGSAGEYPNNIPSDNYIPQNPKYSSKCMEAEYQPNKGPKLINNNYASKGFHNNSNYESRNDQDQNMNNSNLNGSFMIQNNFTNYMTNNFLIGGPHNYVPMNNPKSNYMSPQFGFPYFNYNQSDQGNMQGPSFQKGNQNYSKPVPPFNHNPPFYYPPTYNPCLINSQQVQPQVQVNQSGPQINRGNFYI